MMQTDEAGGLFRETITCIRIIATASPDGARYANIFGNIVARITTMAVMAGKLPP